MCNLLQVLKNRVLKKLITLLFLFSAVQSYSQLYETDWHLLMMYIDGEEVTIPENDEIPFVAANFIEASPVIFETGACNFCSGEVDIIDAFNMVFNSLGCTLNDCLDEENPLFDNLYTGFFMDIENIPISYHYVYIDGEGTFPDEINLVLTAANGDELIYTDLYFLSTPDFRDNKIVLFPNPTQDYFTISSKDENEFSITIYNITGKQVLFQSKLQNTSSINIQNLKSGIYFVSVSDESGNTSVKKLIKK